MLLVFNLSFLVDRNVVGVPIAFWGYVVGVRMILQKVEFLSKWIDGLEVHPFIKERIIPILASGITYIILGLIGGLIQYSQKIRLEDEILIHGRGNASSF